MSLLHEVYVDVYGISVRMQQKKKVLVRESWDMYSVLIAVSNRLSNHCYFIRGLHYIVKCHIIEVFCIVFLHQVNGEKVGLPYSPVQGVNIKTKSRFVMLTTDFGLSVRFDGSSQGGTRPNLKLKTNIRKGFFVMPSLLIF